MNKLALCYLIILSFIINFNFSAQTITSAGSGNWSDGTTWIGGSVPQSTQSVIIANGHTVSVDANSTCRSFTIQGGANSTVLQIADGVSLTAGGARNIIQAVTANDKSNILAINNGTLISTNGITTLDASNNTRKAIIKINNGFVRIANSDLILGATGGELRNIFQFTGSGKLHINGGSLNPIQFGSAVFSGFSTIEYSHNSTAQNLRNFNYDNLIVTGNTTKTFASHTTINKDLTINGGKLSTGNNNITIGGDLKINSTGSLTAGTNNSITCSGNWSITPSPTSNDAFVHNTSTVIFNSANSQTISTTQTGGETFYNLVVNKPSGTLDINSIFRTINGFSVSGANEVKLNANLTIDNNLSIAGTSSLSANSRTISIGGNWDVSSTSSDPFIEGAGVGLVLFNGINEQSITSSLANGETFNRLTINKSSGQLTLNSAVSTKSIVTLSNGIISCASSLFTFSAGSSVTGASNNSYISGPVRKIGNTAFTFPTGKNNFYAPIAISAPSNATHHFTAEYFNTNPDALYDVSLKDVSLHHLSTCEYWILDRTNGNSDVNVTLSWDSRSCGVNLLSDLKVARWNGSQWKDHGNGATTGDFNSGTIRTSGVVTSFSPFTLASSTFNNILPLDLISFDVTKQNQSTVINWVTQSESGISFFELEKSKNAVDWEIISTTKATGSLDTKANYSFVDDKPFANSLSYYRLKTIDEKGTFVYSDIKSISLTESTEFTIYPNPNNGLKLFLTSTSLNSDINIEIVDVQGKSIPFNTSQHLENLLEINPTEILSKGIYTLKIYDNQSVTTKRLILN